MAFSEVVQEALLGKQLITFPSCCATSICRKNDDAANQATNSDSTNQENTTTTLRMQNVYSVGSNLNLLPLNQSGSSLQDGGSELVVAGSDKELSNSMHDFNPDSNASDIESVSDHGEVLDA